MSDLTPYDTGEVLEPVPWVMAWHKDCPPPDDSFGRVDFEDDESATVCQVRVVRDPGTGGYLVRVLDYTTDVTTLVMVGS